MYLKSIDLVGYKSFAAKTHLDLEPGITGIIGPNGCGKSNIMEAVRWCLGEMSWKSLRADSMTDVIFAGTAKRPPLSMTEVTLTFDNAESMLPVQFSEVTVSRRIFRSAESAYFLNKTQCRLRDIREMFLDTGLGGDGYAIIDQGGVDFVLSAKPEDRRSIFEEAAGVAKYKAKREEALRKLERVEMDMSRLQDSVALITEQVKKLDSDARKAKLYQKYKQDLAAMEAAQILQEVGRLQAELESLAAQVAPLEESLGARRTELSAEGANLAALNLEKADQQNQVIASNQRISEVKSEIGRLEERIQSAERSIVEMDDRSAAVEGELATTGERLAGIDPELERAAQAAADAEASRSSAQKESDEWAAQFAGLAQRLADAEASLAALKQEALSASEEALALRRRSDEAASAYSHHETRVRGSLRELEKDLGEVESRRKDLEGAQSALRDQETIAGAARQELSQAEATLAELRRTHQSISDETIRLHSELAQAQAKAEFLEAQGGQNAYWTGAQAVLNARIDGIVGTVRQLIKADDNVKPYLEDVLGERLYALVCEDSAAARAGVELLEASGKGRARFLVLSSLPSQPAEKPYPEEGRPLLRHVGFDPRHERAVRFLLEESYTLGKTLFGEHWVCGGAAQRETVQLSLADIGEIREKVAALQGRRGILAADKASCEAALSAASERVSAAGASFNGESSREHALKASIAEKEAILSLSLRSAEVSTSESAGILGEMALAREEAKALRAQAGKSAEAETEARRREGEAAEGLSAMKEEATKGQSTQEVLKHKLESLADKVSLLAREYERLAQEKRNLEAALEVRRGELAELSRRKETSRSLAAQSRETLGALNAQLASLENEAKAVFGRFQELEKMISEKEASLRALNETAEALQKQLHQFEVQASGHKGTQDVLKKRLWDDWQLTFEEARTKYDGQPVDSEKIEFLRKRIVSLGNVNMAAPEEYEALSQRETFLTSQINDLNQAKEDLKTAIQKINGTTRENFRQTFMEVREHFRRLYGVLFEGGEADLVLTDPENILETGVEIVAQPPGKRLQSISLLSGGEKTLTAIALLFAFFMVKPSPFCMLDEADAALDDANVERFVALLREFQARTQFLIVSHNKRTMEAADVIYGVTMEEMGVSQMVSVDFRKKAKAPAAEPRKEAETHGPFAKDPDAEGAAEPA